MERSFCAASQPPRTLVKSPGVPRGRAASSPRARERGLEVVGELEIGWRLVPNEFCAVTGTNGKTTTTELIGAIHRAAGLAASPWPATSARRSARSPATLDPATRPSSARRRASSSRTATAFAPEVGVFLNFAEDHLDRHGTLERSTCDAKLRIFANQAAGRRRRPERRRAGDPRRRAGGRRDASGSATARDCDLRLESGRLLWQGDALMDASEIAAARRAQPRRTRWRPRRRRSRAASTPRPCAPALREFRGVAHRLEQVAEIGGVLYVNDSKATNVAAAAAALRSFDGGVHAILGGSLKGGELRGARARRGGALPCLLPDRRGGGRARDGPAPPTRRRAAPRAATSSARSPRRRERAQPGEAVLLAPACASFDQYRDFEERGEHFRSLVAELDAAP